MHIKILDSIQPGEHISDIRRVLSYHPFGQPFSAYLQEVLRGPSDWSIGERELFAAFVSKKNQCAY